MDQQQFIKDALYLPSHAISYYISQHLAEYYPDKALVEGDNQIFNVEEYARAGLCEIDYQAPIYNQIETHWFGSEISSANQAQAAIRVLNTRILQPNKTEDEISDYAHQAQMLIKWQTHTLDVVVTHWFEGFGTKYHFWILAASESIAKDFLKEVCRWNAEVRGEILIFSSGCWHKDPRLFQSIQGTTFDNLILSGELKQDIRQDLEQFFAARSTYETYNIPWKRGILFVGPPGNGKTHAVKAIINALAQPCLYIKSFRSEHGTDEGNIQQVFERARKSAPCILVLEDLDSLLNDKNRSFFLNEIDGFATNAGIVTLATTNHPERLDPAILDRPSRFDRKYPFNLPDLPERLAYIMMWNASLQSSLHLSEEATNKLAELTDGFSFAYLKELFLSSMMRWISKQEQDTMEQVMSTQVTTLHQQMLSAINQPEPTPPEEAQNRMLPSFIRRSF